MEHAADTAAPRRVGRYLVYGPIASGGMATVHFGALVGEGGFARTVAIKRLRADRKSATLVAGLLDEARLVSRIQHPNVVPTLDVITTDEGDVLVVLDYVAGESMSRLLRRLEEREQAVPLRFATTMMAGVLHGLHAAHDAKSVRGKPLGVVHRDVSPQNILVGVDGLARVLDFGIAKATERLSRSIAGQVKGKLGYLAPEQLRNKADRRTDIYAAAVVLWEMLAGRRLFWGRNNGELMERVLEMEVLPPSTHTPGVPPELDALVLRNLSRSPDARQDSARQFALALEDRFQVATAAQVGGWVQELAGEALAHRAEIVAEMERDAIGHSDTSLLEQAGAPTLHDTAIESGMRTTLAKGEPTTETNAVPTTAGAGLPPTRPATPNAIAISDEHDARTTEPRPHPSAAHGDETIETHVQALPRAPAPIQSGLTGTLEAAGHAREHDDGLTSEGVETLQPAPVVHPRARRRITLALVVASSTVLGIAAALALRASDPPLEPTDASAPATSHPLPPAERSSETAGRAPLGSPSPTASSAQSPSPSSASPPAAETRSLAVTKPAATLSADAVPPAGPLPTTSSAPTASGKRNHARICDPPFTVDGRGIRRLKPECL